MTAPARTPAEPGSVWTAAAVARRLGVAPGTLRSWSRRYGIGPAGHAPGRHRRYTAADVAELDTMRELVDQGMVLSAAAAIAHRHPRPTAPSPVRVTGPPQRPVAARAPATPDGWEPADLVGTLVSASVDLDSDVACAIVATSMAGHGVVATWEQLCRPALNDLDPAVTADPGCTDAQLLLSWAISTCLRRRSAGSAASGARPVLLGCTAGEQHTLGVEALCAALVERGVPARMLGPAVPGAAFLHAVQRLRPAAVLVWAQRAITAEPGPLARLVPHTDVVLVAGPGWQHVVLPPGVTRIDSLSGALGLLAPPRGQATSSVQPTVTGPP